MEPRRFRLRWRFDYANRPSKFGQWDRDADRIDEKACSQLKEGLLRACVEGKDVGSKDIVILAECDGWDFVNFKWNAEFRGSFQTGQGAHRHVGMKLVTREKELDVSFEGRVVETQRTEEDKQYNYAIFGR